MVYATQSTHKLLAGLSQASQILVQDAEHLKLDRTRFNEAYLMHTSTSPQYAIIASCDVAAAMMEQPGGGALVEESISEALDFRRRDGEGRQGIRQGLVVQDLGPDQIHLTQRLRQARGMVPGPTDKWHGFGKHRVRLQHARPDQGDHRHPKLDVNGRFEAGYSGVAGHQIPAEHGVVVEKTGLYSFFIMFTIGITGVAGTHFGHRAAAVRRWTTTRTSRCGG